MEPNPLLVYADIIHRLWTVVIPSAALLDGGFALIVFVLVLYRLRLRIKAMAHDDRAVAAVSFAITAPAWIMLMAILYYVATVGLATSWLAYATQQGCLAAAQQNVAAGQTVFAGNLSALSSLIQSPTMTATSGPSSVSCSAVGGYSNAFYGILNSPATIQLTAVAVATIPPTK